MSPWSFGWTRRLSDKDKYEITTWAFSYFMKSSLTVSDAVIEAVRKVRPARANEDGSEDLQNGPSRIAVARQEYALGAHGISFKLLGNHAGSHGIRLTCKNGDSAGKPRKSGVGN